MFFDPLKFALFLSAPNTPARAEQAMIGACDLVDFFYANTSFVTFGVHRFKFKIRAAAMTSSISQQTKLELKQTKPPKKQKAKKDPAKQNKNKSKLYSFQMLLQPLIKNPGT